MLCWTSRSARPGHASAVAPCKALINRHGWYRALSRVLQRGFDSIRLPLMPLMWCLSDVVIKRLTQRTPHPELASSFYCRLLFPVHSSYSLLERSAFDKTAGSLLQSFDSYCYSYSFAQAIILLPRWVSAFWKIATWPLLRVRLLSTSLGLL
jgi:hypothetical protein